PLVGTGNPPGHHAFGATPHRTRRRYRMVPLAPRSPSRRTRGSHQIKNATVVLGAGTAGQNGSEPGQAWDKPGTTSVKALAARVLGRDKLRDNIGTETLKSCPTLS